MEKRKKGNLFFRIIFSRTMITMVLLLVQIGILLASFLWLSRYIAIILGSFSVLSFFVIIYIINKEENPAYKMAWIVPIMIVPIVGTLFYLYIESNLGNRFLREYVNVNLDKTKKYLLQDKVIKEEIQHEDPHMAKLVDYISEVGGYPTYKNTKATYFKTGEDKFEEMKIQLEKAEKFIFLEYFIIDLGEMWDTVLEILERKVNAGVEVRVMYDGMCCLILLPYHYPETLKKKGINAKMFSPIKPMLSTHQNSRDHRKILVIDGKVAFNGGINLGDEYINKINPFGHWKDTALMLEGDAVKGLTTMFLQMWNTQKAEASEDFEKYIYMEQESIPNTKGYAIPYGDGPHQKEAVAENVYLDVINTAINYVHIMTPYLILDNEMLSALKFAARRGVEVKIVIPHIPDKWVAFAIAKTHYPELLRAGVQIYEYTPGFVHGKMFVSDDTKAIVGTINLDYRSLYLHFECATFLYKMDTVLEIKQDFDNTFAQSEKITMEAYFKSNVFYRITGSLLRIMGPLM